MKLSGMILRSALFVLLLFSASAGRAQELIVGADFEMYFDNKEFAGNASAIPGIESGTDFAARLIPKIGIRWEEKNTLVFGADMLQHFGQKDSGFLSEVKPIMYYQFLTDHVKAVAGIFTRDMTHSDDYSTAFFTESHKFVHDRMNGVLAQYNSGPSYVEFICDWEGMYSEASREKFRILSSGRHYLEHFYYGYNFSMFHFAARKNSEQNNVVDNLLINPCIGVRFNAFFDFDIKLGLLQTAQRDRSFGHEWEMPRMGEFGLKISRWGFTLDERLYVGQNLAPFFHGHTIEHEDGSTTRIPYGRELYPGESFFRTDKNIYNRASLSYAKWFFNDTVRVRAEFATHYDGSALGSQQILEVAVRFLKTAYDSKNHKK